MKKLIITFLLSISFSLQASAYQWVGAGEWLTITSKGHCDQISLKYQRSSTLLELWIDYKCGQHPVLYPYESYTIDGQQLWLDNEKVGYLSSEDSPLFLYLKRRGGPYTFRLEQTPTGLIFHQLLASRVDFVMIDAVLTQISK